MKNKAVIAGTLSIISGAFSVIGVLTMYLSAVMFYYIKEMPSVKLDPNDPSVVFTVLIIVFCVIGFFWAILGALAIVGGILAIKRKKWGVALAGSLAGAVTCFPCGVAAIIFTAMAKREFNAVEQVPVVEPPPVESTAVGLKQNKAKIAGILTIVSGGVGILSLGWAFLYSTFFSLMMKSPRYSAAGFEDFTQLFPIMYYSMGVYHAILGILAVIFGVFALKRRRWGLALAGAILATITFYPCGIPALIFIIMSQKEFESRSVSTAAV